MFRNTFENVPEHYRNVPELFELFQNTFENIPKHFLKTVLMFRNNVPEHFFELFRNTFEKHSGTLLKIFHNIFENRLNVSEQCSKTL